MIGEETAYAALGLRRGASRSEIEEAYRRLIKRYHPDMAGGDAARAAEINRAYTQLRRSGAAPAVRVRPRPPAPIPRTTRPKGRRFGLLVVALGAIAGTVGLASERAERLPVRATDAIPLRWVQSVDAGGIDDRRDRLSSFDEPLHDEVIDRAIRDAVRLNSEGDVGSAVEFSRDCNNKLRDDPSLAWFDSCAAFDEAMVALTANRPLSESGRFGAAAVVSRQIGAARMVSDDVLAADGRLQRIRSRVELSLLPRIDDVALTVP